jgi:hypothetical protein
VSDPAAPAEIASYPATDARAVFARTPANDQESGLNPDGKSYAYVADGGAGMLTIDVSDPAAPQKVTEWSADTMGEATDIAVNVPGSRVILADGTAGLSVHSLSDDDYDPDNDYGATDIPTADPCFITSVLGR